MNAYFVWKKADHQRFFGLSHMPIWGIPQNDRDFFARRLPWRGSPCVWSSMALTRAQTQTETPVLILTASIAIAHD